ncbi:MAG: V-type ATP synthase subunit A, partial [Synergistaceae bacterium]|nr:V-type ATP synthase subunit A [Synergistaceae bacterium]
ASLLKNGYLQQGAFGQDSYCPPLKAIGILDAILAFHEKADRQLHRGCPLSLLQKLPEVAELNRLREIPAGEEKAFEDLKARLFEQMDVVDRERTAPGREG